MEDKKLEDHSQWEEHGNEKGTTSNDDLITKKINLVEETKC